MRAVVFDAMGVLYRSWDDLAELLIPFAREHGCALPDADIGALYRRASAGEMTSAQLWERLGVAGDPAELDRRHLARHRLVRGIVELIDELRTEGTRLGCISNDVSEWSLLLRSRHGLDRRIAHWTVSGDVGARKPDERIFRAFLAACGIPPHAVTFIDDRPKNVRAAAALGFRTLLVDFAGVGHAEGGIRSVAELRAAIAAGTDHSRAVLAEGFAR